MSRIQRESVTISIRDYEIAISFVRGDKKKQKPFEIFDIPFLAIISSNFKVEDS